VVKKLKFKEQKEPELFRLDLGTGKGNKRPLGFIGVDIHGGKGILKVDLRKRWPWKSKSVDEVHCDYLLQYFNAAERVHFMQELYRVLKPEGKAVIIVPYWCAHKAYMDAGIAWPPISEGWFQTLAKPWREGQNYQDVSGLDCDFDSVLGYGMHPLITERNLEYQQHAVGFYKEAAQDLYATLTPRK